MTVVMVICLGYLSRDTKALMTDAVISSLCECREEKWRNEPQYSSEI